MNNIRGTHIFGDLTMCDKDYLFSLEMGKVKKEAFEIIARNNLTVLGSYFHPFENGAFTGVIALSESHVT
ncbi:S-adenosylmethionine decarboxylase, partial [Patescibacteria group bacterium]|nr:S-adenosylmethionine decarboxylase [Patescibacteria group bacterium]MBU1952226.1 S-adenosylmethionine decarboxylase [Patescibacteria group bacterium]